LRRRARTFGFGFTPLWSGGPGSRHAPSPNAGPDLCVVCVRLFTVCVWLRVDCAGGVLPRLGGSLRRDDRRVTHCYTLLHDASGQPVGGPSDCDWRNLLAFDSLDICQYQGAGTRMLQIATIRDSLVRRHAATRLTASCVCLVTPEVDLWEIPVRFLYASCTVLYAFCMVLL
jgi:hypothetical protein